MTTSWTLGARAGALAPDPLQYVAPGRPFSTEHTRLDLDLDLENRKIAGSVTHTMVSLRDGLDAVALNCVGLAIESVSIDGREADYDYPVPSTHSTSWIGSADVSETGDQLVVHPDVAFSRGDRFELSIRYHGSPKQGLYWVGPEKGIPGKRYEVWSQGEGEENRFWIPCHDYPDDKSTFEGVFRVDRGYFVLSNGDLVSTEQLGGKTQYTWRLDEPQVSYLIMIAAARYEVYKDDWNGVELMYVVPPGTKREAVDRSFGRTPDMMEFFTRTIGIDYPFPKYAQVTVQNFIYGGMENSSATTLNTRVLLDDRAALTGNQDGLIAHELAHQWWGDMVTCREWTNMWLNEGFATYYQSLFQQHYEGDDAFRYSMFTRHAEIARRDAVDSRPMVVDFYNRKDSRNNSNIYIKGASTLHMLRFLLGDALFHEVMRHYASKHAHGLVDTGDFARAVRNVTGENLDWFFEQWVYLAGHPAFKVSKSWIADSHTLKLTVQQTQDTGGLIPVFRVPLDVELTCDEKAETRRIVVERDSQDFYFELPSKPRMVIFDKGDWILKTLDFPKTVPELVYQLENGDYISRVRAAQALGGKPATREVVAALREALHSPGHWGLPREAALALGKLDDENAKRALLEGLKMDRARVRLASAEALASYKYDEGAAEKLAAVLHEDPAWAVRAAAVTSLVKMRSGKARRACREAIEQESYQDVVRNAGLDGLAELDDPAELPRIAGLAKAPNRRTHRDTAIRAYGDLAASLERQADREKATRFLADMLDDPFLRTRQAVVAALAKIDCAASVDALTRAGAADPDARVRAQAERAARKMTRKQKKQDEVSALGVEIEALKDKIGALESELDAVRKRAGDE